MTRRLPPFEIREGETILVQWTKGGDVQVQLRLPGPAGRIYTSRATYPPDLFRRPPNASTADWIRQELVAEQQTAITTQRSNRKPKRPRW